MDDATFPSTDAHRYLCGLLCDLVANQPGLRFDAYVDGIVVAHKKSDKLLHPADRAVFRVMVRASPIASADPTKIPWRDMVSLLTLRRAIVRDGDQFRAGPDMASFRKSYPEVPAELFAMIRRAWLVLRDLQANYGGQMQRPRSDGE